MTKYSPVCEEPRDVFLQKLIRDFAGQPLSADRWQVERWVAGLATARVSPDILLVEDRFISQIADAYAYLVDEYGRGWESVAFFHNDLWEKDPGEPMISMSVAPYLGEDKVTVGIICCMPLTEATCELLKSLNWQQCNDISIKGEKAHLWNLHLPLNSAAARTLRERGGRVS